MQITLTIPDAHDNRVINAFAAVHGYQDSLTTENPSNGRLVTTPSPETRLEFVKRKLIEHLRSAVAAFEGEQGVVKARQDAEASAKQIAIS